MTTVQLGTATRIPLMRSLFTDEADARDALAGFILSGARLSMGEWCLRFEQEFAAHQGRTYAVLFNSGSSANLALLQALRNMRLLKAGDFVGFSTVTWSTNVMPIIQLGMSPVPIDVTPRTLNSMADNVEYIRNAYSLDAVFITNALGFLPDLDVIRDVCQRRHMILLEDNCESLGSELPSGKAGNFGLASTFSFYVAHHMSTIEGGMVCTDDPKLADMLRIVRANGWDRHVSAERQAMLRAVHGVASSFEAAYTFYDLGYNFRPTEITGFLGCHQLQRLEANIERRIQHFNELEAVARRNSAFLPLKHDHQSRLSPFAFPVVVRNSADRPRYIERFQRAGVEVRPLIAGNITRQPFWHRYADGRNAVVANAEYLHSRGFYFGIYPDLMHEDLAVLKDCLCESW